MTSSELQKYLEQNILTKDHLWPFYLFRSDREG